MEDCRERFPPKGTYRSGHPAGTPERSHKGFRNRFPERVGKDGQQRLCGMTRKQTDWMLGCRLAESGGEDSQHTDQTFHKMIHLYMTTTKLLTHPPKKQESAHIIARNLQINDDLLILHRDKIIPKYCGGLCGGCPSCRRDDGLSRSIAQEEKERTTEIDSRAGQTQART